MHRACSCTLKNFNELSLYFFPTFQTGIIWKMSFQLLEWITIRQYLNQRQLKQQQVLPWKPYNGVQGVKIYKICSAWKARQTVRLKSRKERKWQLHRFFLMYSCNPFAPKTDKNISKVALKVEFKDGSCWRIGSCITTFNTTRLTIADCLLKGSLRTTS